LRETLGVSRLEHDVEDEKNRLIATLSYSEAQAFQWLREGFSPNWTAETMMINHVEMRRIKKSICEKLHVDGIQELLMHYAKTDRRPILQ